MYVYLIYAFMSAIQPPTLVAATLVRIAQYMFTKLPLKLAQPLSSKA